MKTLQTGNSDVIGIFCSFCGGLIEEGQDNYREIDENTFICYLCDPYALEKYYYIEDIEG